MSSLVHHRSALVLLVLAVGCGPKQEKPKAAAQPVPTTSPAPARTAPLPLPLTELPPAFADLPSEGLEALLYDATFAMGEGWGVEYETDNSVEAFRQKDLSIFAGPYTAELRLRSFGNPAQARQHPVVGNHARVGGPYQLDVESWHTGESERLLQMMMPAGHDISDIRLEAVKQILESAGYKIVEEDWREPLDPSSGAYLAVVGNGREGSVAWHYVPGTEEEPMRDPYGLNHGAIRNQGSSRVEIEVLTTSLEASRMTDQLIAKALELWTTCPSCVSRAAAY